MVAPRFDIPSLQLAQLCRRCHIRKLSLFGSALRDDFSPDSDVDLLVEFQSGKTPDFFTLDEIANELSTLFGGHRIDLVTQASINPLIREQVLGSARVQYEG